jgi:hypothetical protein
MSGFEFLVDIRSEPVLYLGMERLSVHTNHTYYPISVKFGMRQAHIMRLSIFLVSRISEQIRPYISCRRNGNYVYV